MVRSRLFHGFACAVLIVFAVGFRADSQSLELQRFAVYFKDKANNPYSIYNPSAYLSPRALERRNRQRIPVDQKDLPVTPQYVQSVASVGCTVLNKSKWLNAVTVRLTDSASLAKLKAMPFVSNVKRIAAYKNNTLGKGVVKRPFQFASTNRTDEIEPTYGMALRQIDILNGVGLHRKGFTGAGVLVAVFDAGFHNADVFPGLQPIMNSGRLLATRDFVNPGGSVFNNANHGTQCFGLIGMYQPGVMIGTAPGALFVLCHTEDGDSEMPIEEYNWAAAAEYADSIGVDVISSSLGYSRFDDSSLNHTYADLDGNTTVAARAADWAASKGIVVVNSAGNSGNNDWFYITTPADADSILAVGAVDADEKSTAFTSHGYSADGRVKPDVMGMGALDFVANPDVMDYKVGSGTSYSCPTIAGMAACLIQAHPNRTSQEIVQAIRRSADRFFNPDTTYGYGIPDFQLADLMLSDIELHDFDADPTPMIYPNPFHENVTVVHRSDIQENGRIEILDMMGRVQAINDFTIQPGYNQLVTNFQNRATGMYIIRLVTESRSYELKALHQ